MKRGLGIGVVLFGLLLLIGSGWIAFNKFTRRSGSSDPMASVATMRQVVAPPPTVTGGGVTTRTQDVNPLFKSAVAAIRRDGLGKKLSTVTAMAIDRQRRLFVGTEGEGLWCFDPSTDAWQSLKPDGVNDQTVLAIVVDGVGRVWVGHSHSGVSVWNGQAWKNYDLVTGPLGERVWDIRLDPASSAVWMATNRGVAIYADQTWRYLTASTLVSDDIRRIAFGRNGKVYLATACDGLLIGSTDIAAGGAWQQVQGPERRPTAASGQGLSSNLINDVLATADGVVYVASRFGLSISEDDGKTWRFERGKEWADQVEERTGGAPESFDGSAPGLLGEDNCTRLAATSDGRIVVAHLETSADVLDPKTRSVRATAVGTYARSILADADGSVLVGGIANGLMPVPTTGGAGALPARTVSAVEELPAPTVAPTVEELSKLRARLTLANRAGNLPAYLGSDWATRGDGVARYGWQYKTFPWHGATSWQSDYQVHVSIGPTDAGKGGVYTYYANNDSKDPRAMFLPNKGKRVIGEWNDGSFQRGEWPPEIEGPDLWFHVNVPAGVHRVALLAMNNDGHQGDNRNRDHLVELKAYDAEKSKVNFAPALARCRLNDHYEPCIISFVVEQGSYWIKMSRNGSHVTKAAAVYIDKLAGLVVEQDKLAPSNLGKTDYRPSFTGEIASPPAAKAAWELWRTLDENWSAGGWTREQLPLRLLAYRAAVAAGAPAELLAAWRVQLPIWTAQDRSHFAARIVELNTLRPPDKVER